MIDEQVRQETHIYYQDENGLILTPLTMDSCITWGRGTRWCVADKFEDFNRFDSYNTTGHIIVYITNEWKYVPETKKNHQLKFFGHIKEHYLLDMSVRPVSYELPASLQKLILKSCLLPFLFEHGNIHPFHFAPGTFSQTEIDTLIKQGFGLSEFHRQDITEANCITAIEHISPWQIKMAPPHAQTEKTCISAVRKSFQVIHDIDRNLPYFENVRRAAFESYQERDASCRDKQIYKPWFEDLLAQNENDRTRRSIPILVP